MDVLIALSVPLLIVIVITQFIFTERGVNQAQDKAIKELQEGDMECGGHSCAVIGNIFGHHLLGTKDGWSVFDESGNLVVCAPIAKMSLIHRWKQKKLEKMADMYYENQCLSFSATMRQP